MGTVNFDINNALKHYMSDPAAIATTEADDALLDCESDPESLTSDIINSVLDPIVDSVAANADAITRSNIFDSLQFLLKCAPVHLHQPMHSHSRPLSSSPATSPTQHGALSLTTEPVSKLFHLCRFTAFLPAHALSKVFDLIVSGFAATADAVHHDLEAPADDGDIGSSQDMIAHHKQLLEMYAFLLQWTIAAAETKANDKTNAPVVAARRGTKGKKSSAAAANKDRQEAAWDSATQLQSALDVMCRVMKLRLGKIFLTTSERDTFIGLLTRPVYMILENEQRVKTTSIRMHCFKVLCIAVKHHGHGYGECMVSSLPGLLDADV